MEDWKFKQKIQTRLQHDKLSREREYELFEKGDRESLLEVFDHSEKLAYKMAITFEKWVNKIQGTSISFEDLSQEASSITWELILSHDHNKGRFSTYLYNSGYQKMGKYVRDNMHFVHITPHDSAYVPLIKAIAVDMEEELNRWPTDQEFLDHEVIKNIKLSDPKKLDLLKSQVGYTSLNVPSEFAGSKFPDQIPELLDMQPDQNWEKPFDEVENKIDIDIYCEYLNDKQEYVFRNFMLGDDHREDVAEVLDISDKRVYQIAKEVEKILKDKIER